MHKALDKSISNVESLNLGTKIVFTLDCKTKPNKIQKAKQIFRSQRQSKIYQNRQIWCKRSQTCNPGNNCCLFNRMKLWQAEWGPPPCRLIEYNFYLLLLNSRIEDTYFLIKSTYIIHFIP